MKDSSLASQTVEANLMLDILLELRKLTGGKQEVVVEPLQISLLRLGEVRYFDDIGANTGSYTDNICIKTIDIDSTLSQGLNWYKGMLPMGSKLILNYYREQQRCVFCLVPSDFPDDKIIEDLKQCNLGEPACQYLVELLEDTEYLSPTLHLNLAHNVGKDTHQEGLMVVNTHTHSLHVKVKITHCGSYA